MYNNPKPAKTTLAITIKKLKDKKFVAYDKIGSARLYYAIVKKENYFCKQMKNLIHHFFVNSTSIFTSFFSKEASLRKEELQNLHDLNDDELKNK